MSPRVVERKNCPHCKAALPEPTPRVCPACAGSLQKRHLSLGCLSSAPPVVLALLGAAWALREVSEVGKRAVERASARSAVAQEVARDGGRAPRPSR